MLAFPLHTINTIHPSQSCLTQVNFHSLCMYISDEVFTAYSVTVHKDICQLLTACPSLTENVRMLASNEATEYSRIDSPHCSFCKRRSYYGQWWTGRDRGTRRTAVLHPLQWYSGKPLRGTRTRFERNCTRKVRNALASFPARPPRPAFVACSMKSGGEGLDGFITWCVPLLTSL